VAAVESAVQSGDRARVSAIVSTWDRLAAACMPEGPGLAASKRERFAQFRDALLTYGGGS